MVGYGVDIHAPHPPFVLAKVLYRNTAVGTIVAPFYYLARMVVRLGAGLGGYFVGLGAGEGREGGGRTSESVLRAGDLRMVDDELL